MIELKITADDATDLRKQLTAILSWGSIALVAGAGGVGGTTSVKDAPKAAPKPKAEPITETPADETPSEDGPKVLGYETDITPVVLKLAEVKGRDAVIGLLAEFNVTNAKQIAVEDYPSFLAAAQAAIDKEG